MADRSHRALACLDTLGAGDSRSLVDVYVILGIIPIQPSCPRPYPDFALRLLLRRRWWDPLRRPEVPDLSRSSGSDAGLFGFR